MSVCVCESVRLSVINITVKHKLKFKFIIKIKIEAILLSTCKHTDVKLKSGSALLKIFLLKLVRICI